MPQYEISDQKKINTTGLPLNKNIMWKTSLNGVKSKNHRTQSPTGSQPYQIVVTQRSSSSPSGYITLITITIYALNKTGQKTSNYCVGDVKAIKKEFSTN